MLKKILFVLFAVLIFGCSISDYSNSGVEVVYEMDNSSYSKGDLKEIENSIIKDHPEASKITIYEVNLPSVKSRYKWYDLILDTKTTKTLKRTSSTTKFVTSVAKGQTREIGKEWKYSVKASATGGVSAASLGLNLESEKKYKRTDKFSGPPESSQYNSRRFYVKFHKKHGTYKREITGRQSKHTTVKTGTYTEPNGYDSYSVDSKQ